MKENDKFWMGMALELAEKAAGLCSPNPMVGAVVVKDGSLIGRGYHHKAGQPHAEPNALDDAGADAKGATLYVTLEPCSTHGRTPPCTERIIREGIKRVVIGSTDKNPAHAGAAIGILREAGIEVEQGVLEEECHKLNESFFWWIRSKQPFVLLKMAMTLDGKIATSKGQSKWITDQVAREYVQKLRRWSDGVMIGGKTLEADDSTLSVRYPQNWPCQPRRFIWTSRGALPPQSRMLWDGGPAPELVKPRTYEEWQAFLRRIGGENVTALLLEGGGELAASALQAGIVNKVAFFIAPKILCGRGGRPVVGGEDPESLDNGIVLERMETQTIGRDILVTGYCTNVHRID